jgi:hypothetical protein
MGTNRDALQQVIEHLKNEARAGERQLLTLFRNEEAGKRQLLIPVYRTASGLMAEQRELPGFEVTRPEFDLLQRYVGYLGDDRVLLANYEAEPASFIVGSFMVLRLHQERRTSNEERRTRTRPGACWPTSELRHRSSTG